MSYIDDFLTKFVLVYVKKPNRLMVRSALKALGFKEIKMFADPTKLSQQIAPNPMSLTVLEWDDQLIPQLLYQSRGNRLYDPRPIYLIVEENTPNVMDIISDFKINRIHMGKPTEAEIIEEVSQIFDQSFIGNKHLGEMTQLTELQEKKDLKGMEDLLSHLMMQYPGNIRWKMELVAVLIENKNWTQANELLNDSLLVNCKQPRLLHLKARLALYEKKFDIAETCLKKATALNPHDANRLIDLGDTLFAQTKVKEAEEAYDKGLELEPEHIGGKKGKASCSLLRGKIGPGIDLINSLNFESERASVFNNAGVMAIRKRKYDHAIKLYDLALQNLKEKRLLARVTYNKSLVYMRQEQPEKAKPLLEQALGYDETFAKAKDAYERLQTKYPDLASLESEATDHDDLDDFEANTLSNFDEAL